MLIGSLLIVSVLAVISIGYLIGRLYATKHDSVRPNLVRIMYILTLVGWIIPWFGGFFAALLLAFSQEANKNSNQRNSARIISVIGIVLSVVFISGTFLVSTLSTIKHDDSQKAVILDKDKDGKIFNFLSGKNGTPPHPNGISFDDVQNGKAYTNPAVIKPSGEFDLDKCIQITDAGGTCWSYDPYN